MLTPLPGGPSPPGLNAHQAGRADTHALDTCTSCQPLDRFCFRPSKVERPSLLFSSPQCLSLAASTWRRVTTSSSTCKSTVTRIQPPLWQEATTILTHVTVKAFSESPKNFPFTETQLVLGTVYSRHRFCLYVAPAPRLLENCPAPQAECSGGATDHSAHPWMTSKACRSSSLGLGTGVRRQQPLSVQAPGLGVSNRRWAGWQPGPICTMGEFHTSEEGSRADRRMGGQRPT